MGPNLFFRCTGRIPECREETARTIEIFLYTIEVVQEVISETIQRVLLLDNCNLA